MTEGAHPLPPLPVPQEEIDAFPPRGWHGAPFVPPDGQNWPLKIAAEMLDLPEQDIRDQVRIIENIKGESIASGVIKANAYTRQGRQPRAYPAKKLIAICEDIRSLAENL